MKLKTFFLSVSVISLCLLNCDGRRHKNDALNNSIEKYKHNLESAESTKIVPESYTEIVTDTITGSGFDVRIKNYSLMDDEDLLLVKKISNNNFEEVLHRKYESQILVKYHSKDIFKLRVNADLFNLKDNDQFWQNATLQHTWLDLDNSVGNTLTINFSFIDPSNQNSKMYSMHIDSHGDYEIILIDDNLI